MQYAHEYMTEEDRFYDAINNSALLRTISPISSQQGNIENTATDDSGISDMSSIQQIQNSLPRLDSVSSSGVELKEFLNEKDMEFDAQHFAATSTPKGGRSVQLSQEFLDHDMPSQVEAVDSNTHPPPPQILSHPSVSHAVRPHSSILRSSLISQDERKSRGKLSEKSLHHSSKVSFDNVVQTYHPQSDSEEEMLSSHDISHDKLSSLMDTLEQRKIYLELPELAGDPKELQPRDIKAKETEPHDKASSASTPYFPSPRAPDMPREHKSVSYIDEAVVKDFVDEVFKLSNSRSHNSDLRGKYVTPSKLHQKIRDRERTDKNQADSPMSYTTPSRLHQKILDRERGEQNQADSFTSYTTPSKLDQKIADRERTDHNQVESILSYTTPSDLLLKRKQHSMTKDEKSGSGSEGTFTPEEMTSILLATLESDKPLGQPSKETLAQFLEQVKKLDRKAQMSSVSQPVYGHIANKLEKIIATKGRRHSHLADYVSRPEQLRETVQGKPNRQRPVPAEGQRTQSAHTRKVQNVEAGKDSQRHTSLPAFKNRATSAHGSDKNVVNSPAGNGLSESDLSASSAKDVTSRFCNFDEEGFASDEMTPEEEPLIHSWNRFSSLFSLTGNSSSDESSIRGKKYNVEFPNDSVTSADSGFTNESRFSNSGFGSQSSDLWKSYTTVDKPSSTDSKLYNIEGAAPPHRQEKTNIKNMVLVNQTIVDMVNAVSIYKKNMTEGGENKRQEEAHSQYDSPDVKEVGTQKSSGELSKPPEESQSSSMPKSPPPVTPFTNYLTLKPFPSTSTFHSDTDMVIKEINDRLLKMRDVETTPMYTKYDQTYPGPPTTSGSSKYIENQEATTKDQAVDTLSMHKFNVEDKGVDTLSMHKFNVKDQGVDTLSMHKFNVKDQGVDTLSMHKFNVQDKGVDTLSMHKFNVQDKGVDTLSMHKLDVKDKGVDTFSMHKLDGSHPNASLPSEMSMYLTQKTGASLPTSRTASPDADQVNINYHANFKFHCLIALYL